jgi:adenylate kinase family enzyme
MNARFIVMSGLPTSGKSTLGRAIAKTMRLPLLDKDDILEVLFESRGIGDADWRRRLSRIADQELIERATKLPSAVIASWWHHPRSSAASGTPTEWLQSLHGDLVEIYCVCSPNAAVSRFLGRARHAGHLDGQYTVEGLLESFQNQVAFGPLKVGRIIEVCTEDQPDFAWLLNQLGFERGVGGVCTSPQTDGALRCAGVPRPSDSSIPP